MHLGIQVNEYYSFFDQFSFNIIVVLGVSNFSIVSVYNDVFEGMPGSGFNSL